MTGLILTGSLVSGFGSTYEGLKPPFGEYYALANLGFGSTYEGLKLLRTVMRKFEISKFWQYL